MITVIAEPNQSLVTIIREPMQTVVMNSTPVMVTVMGTPGPQGAQGERGATGTDGGSTVTMVANGDIGGHRVVIPDGFGGAMYADCNQISHAGKVVGITTHAAVAGGSIGVATSGEVVESSWNWSAGPVYLSTNGVLSQITPISGFVQIVGVALSATRLSVQIGPSIVIN